MKKLTETEISIYSLLPVNQDNGKVIYYSKYDCEYCNGERMLYNFYVDEKTGEDILDFRCDCEDTD